MKAALSDLSFEKSADQMDEIQIATAREPEIRNVDRESALLRQVRAALVRNRKTPRGGAVGGALYPVPGRRRSGWAGDREDQVHAA
jgi:hypothetical protein